LQWLQNAGNRMLFFIAVILYSFSLEMYSFLCMDFGKHSKYLWLITQHAYTELLTHLMLCQQHNTIRHRFWQIILYFLLYSALLDLQRTSNVIKHHHAVFII
jgi:hypothetical protein